MSLKSGRSATERGRLRRENISRRRWPITILDRVLDENLLLLQMQVRRTVTAIVAAADDAAWLLDQRQRMSDLRVVLGEEGTRRILQGERIQSMGRADINGGWWRQVRILLLLMVESTAGAAATVTAESAVQNLHLMAN